MGSRFVTSGATSSQEILHSLLVICFQMARESTIAKGVHEILYVAGTSSFDLLYNNYCTKKTASFKKIISNLIYTVTSYFRKK